MGQNIDLSNMIETSTGLSVNLLAPTADSILIEDIAHALSQTCRFGGHTKHFYSVAEHSLFVVDILNDERLQLAALLHDAHEAYIGDIPSPLKSLLPNFAQLEIAFDRCIAQRFNIDEDLFADEQLKAADKEALLYEAERLMPSLALEWGDSYETKEHNWSGGLSSNEAKRLYLDKFASLMQ